MAKVSSCRVDQMKCERCEELKLVETLSLIRLRIPGKASLYAPRIYRYCRDCLKSKSVRGRFVVVMRPLKAIR